MANKQLTANVRLNTSQAEQKLRNISKAIDAINRAVGRESNAYNQVNAALNTTVRTTNKVKTKTDETTKSTKKWSNALSEVNSKLNGSSRSVGLISSKLRGLASTYLGVMGMGAVIETTDTITSAENKLNYTSAQALGAKGTNADGSYSQATFNATQDAMDKMYASSQKVRMGYTDMMSNVSKSMALAGGAFDNSTDKAIRFQEIMAEAYAVGGASAQEMSSSMYQMIQALGSGTLAGDELRSVREGAPLAYKAIEEFAQGVYNCKDSLKDMASEGMITSEMVVAAIMNAGNEMDSAFAQTEQTFAQTWEQIKNTAIRAFAPVSKMLREELNKAIDNGLVEKATTVFNNIAKGIMIAFAVIKNVIVWIADNWNWLQHVVIGAIILMITYMLIKAGVATYCAIVEMMAWMRANSAMITQLVAIGFIIAGILLLLYVVYLWRNGAIETCDAIAWAVLALGLIVIGVLILIGTIASAGALLIALAVVAAIVLILMYFAEFCGYVNIGIQAIVNAFLWCCNLICAIGQWLWAVLCNIASGIANFFIACWNWICAAGQNAFAGIVNFGMGLWNSLSAIAQNIGIAFQNAWIWCKNTFWEFIADVLEGVSKLEPVINGIAELLGKSGVDFGSLISGARSKKGEYKEFVSVSAAWDSGMNTKSYQSLGDAWSSGMNTYQYKDLGKAWDKGWNTYDVFQDGWSKDAYNSGYSWGKNIEDSVNKWGSKFQNTDKSKEKTSLLDKLGSKLGLDFSGFGGSGDDLADGIKKAIDDPSKVLGDDPSKALKDALDKGSGGSGGSGSLPKNVSDIADNTGSIADSMELADEDIEYLRKIAEMEWKKEYTTANITVDMSNYNTINGESDLDGIVTKLSDKLREEMSIVANGVYAY